MKVEKFPKRIQSILDDFDQIENKKRFRILIHFNKKVLVISRIFFNAETNTASLKYSAQSKKEYPINNKFINAITDIQIEKVSVIRKKLHLKAPTARRTKTEYDKFGIPIKKSRKIRKNKELSELEFKSMFDENYIDLELRDKFFEETNLSGGAKFPKKYFKSIPKDCQETVDEFLSMFQGFDIDNEYYKRDNYHGLSLIVGKSFTNMGQLDPRFKTTRTFVIKHRLHQKHIEIITNNVKAGKDTIYYLINENTMLKTFSGIRYRNR